jgi:hypothetical protein
MGELDLEPGHYYRSRLLCDVLGEMRTCCKHLNFSSLPSLIEEAQHMGSHMEEALGDQKYLRGLHDKIKKGREELKRLKEEVEVYKGKVAKQKEKEGKKK